MNLLKGILLVIFSIFGFSTGQGQVDTVMHPMDSAITTESDPTTEFFQNGERAASPARVMLITKSGKTISLSAFLKAPDMMYSDHTLTDLDKDGKKELLISNFTGGAHCCDEIYIFRNIGLNKYQHAAKLFAGNTAISKEKEFVYNFHEPFGYFFTCFACGYSDTSDAAPIEIRSITLKYNKGKLSIVPGDKELRNTITDNLGKLAESPYEKLEDDIAQDNGLRKELAMNLAVFYYSFGKNWVETQKLFNKYYKHPDAKMVWTAFVKNIQFIKKDSGF